MKLSDMPRTDAVCAAQVRAEDARRLALHARRLARKLEAGHGLPTATDAQRVKLAYAYGSVKAECEAWQYKDEPGIERNQARGGIMHTPGPWKAATSDEIGGDVPRVVRFNVEQNGYNTIATLTSTVDDDQDNARLIAAAPDLLESCRKALKYLALEYLNSASKAEPDESLGVVVRMLQNAIAKAKAEEKS